MMAAAAASGHPMYPGAAPFPPAFARSTRQMENFATPQTFQPALPWIFEPGITQEDALRRVRRALADRQQDQHQPQQPFGYQAPSVKVGATDPSGLAVDVRSFMTTPRYIQWHQAIQNEGFQLIDPSRPDLLHRSEEIESSLTVDFNAVRAKADKQQAQARMAAKPVDPATAGIRPVSVFGMPQAELSPAWGTGQVTAPLPRPSVRNSTVTVSARPDFAESDRVMLDPDIVEKWPQQIREYHERRRHDPSAMMGVPPPVQAPMAAGGSPPPPPPSSPRPAQPVQQQQQSSVLVLPPPGMLSSPSTSAPADTPTSANSTAAATTVPLTVSQASPAPLTAPPVLLGGGSAGSKPLFVDPSAVPRPPSMPHVAAQGNQPAAAAPPVPSKPVAVGSPQPPAVASPPPTASVADAPLVGVEELDAEAQAALLAAIGDDPGSPSAVESTAAADDEENESAVVEGVADESAEETDGDDPLVLDATATTMLAAGPTPLTSPDTNGGAAGSHTGHSTEMQSTPGAFVAPVLRPVVDVPPPPPLPPPPAFTASPTTAAPTLAASSTIPHPVAQPSGAAFATQHTVLGVAPPSSNLQSSAEILQKAPKAQPAGAGANFAPSASSSPRRWPYPGPKPRGVRVILVCVGHETFFEEIGGSSRAPETAMPPIGNFGGAGVPGGRQHTAHSTGTPPPPPPPPPVAPEKLYSLFDEPIGSAKPAPSAAGVIGGGAFGAPGDRNSPSSTAWGLPTPAQSYTSSGASAGFHAPQLQLTAPNTERRDANAAAAADGVVPFTQAHPNWLMH
jgi:hypothetical protein